MKEKITKWYRQGLWSGTMVKNAVTKGLITQTEYLEIVEDKALE